ncbi:hypothetical protein [Spirosoma koreense]
MVRFRLPACYALLSAWFFGCTADYPATAPYTITVPVPTTGGHGSSPSTPTGPTAPPARLFLTNDKVKLGIDLNAGGAITYLSEASSSVNMVSNPDYGRQIQTSIYTGPFPYIQNGKLPVPEWRNLGWNPVQTGDYYNHSSRIVSYQQGPNRLYVKSIPLIWPLFDEQAECFYEHWYELSGNTVHVRCHITVFRADTTQYGARTQEMPCVYLTGPYYRMVSYLGSKPFTNDATSEFYDDGGYYYRFSPEHWTALLNDQGRGVGLYKPDEVRFGTAKFGTERYGGEFDGASGYMNTQTFLLIDHNGQYDYEYTLVLGNLDDIRRFAYSQPRSLTYPDFRFVNDRQGWFYNNTQDTGWPIQNELKVRWERDSLQKSRFFILSPMRSWNAADVPKLYIRAAFQTKGTVARFLWFKPEDGREISEAPNRYLDFPIIGDGQFRTYEVNVGQSGGWNGLISQIALTSPDSQFAYEKGSTVRIQSVTTTPP